MFVCICNGVTDGEIRQAVDEGAASVRDINKTMSVGNCCGKCTPVARQVINDQLDSLAVDAVALSAVS